MCVRVCVSIRLIKFYSSRVTFLTYRRGVHDVSICIYQGDHNPGKSGKPGILRDFSKRGKLREFSRNSVQPQGKIVTNKVFLFCHSNIWSVW